MTKKEEQKGNLLKSITTLSTDDKEKGLQTLLEKTNKAKEPEQDEVASKEKHRITLDLSKGLARKVKIEAGKRDLTLKGFIVELLNKYFDEKDSK